MRPIAEAELARLRANYASALPDRCAIGAADAPPTPCRVETAAPEPIFITSGETPGFDVYFPHGTAIPPTARLWIVAQWGEIREAPVELLAVGVPRETEISVVVTARRRV